MPKIKTPYKRYSFKKFFFSERDNVALKPEFKTFSKGLMKYLDNKFIFKLPEVHSEMKIPPRDEQFKKINSFNLNRIKQITSSKVEKEKILMTEKYILQNIQIKSEDKNMVTIAEIKKEFYYFS